jgi:DNA modification methylase
VFLLAPEMSGLIPMKSLVTVSEIQAAPYNPRKITDEQLLTLKRSMEAFGDLSGIVVNRRTSHMVGGHQRIKHLEPSWKIKKHPLSDKVGTVAAGYIETPFGRFSYREVDWELKKEKAANLAANKISGDWDNQKLAPLLEELVVTPELFDMTGFNMPETNLIIETMAEAGDENIDEAPPLPATPFTKPGQLLKLGKHRLLCGDATDPKAWRRLMGAEKAALCITDPPYGTSYNVHNKSKYDKIKGAHEPHRSRPNIKGDTDTKVALEALPQIFSNLIDQGVLYLTCGTDLAVDTIQWLREHHIHYGTLMVWNKQFDVVSWNRYHAAHELIVFAGKGSRPGRLARWFGPKHETTVWDIKLDARGDRVHPTQKPVALYERAMVNSSEPREIVLDPFAGSGTSVIAAEKHGRRAFMMETDPAYCDVIVKRWMTFCRKP